MPNVSSVFLTTAFQSVLTVEAIFFGVFGFLYSVYALYSSLATPEHPVRAPICNILKNLCRIIAVLLMVNGGIFGYALFLLGPTGHPETVLAVGLVVSVLTMVFISALMSFRYME
jgi:hypothetical protein